MKTIFLNEIPRKCPRCDVYIFTETPVPKIGKKAWAVTGLGVLATGLWIFLFFTFSDFPVDMGGVGWLVLAFVYGWPFYVSALIAWKLPLEVTSKCFKCKDFERYRIKTPKL